MRARKMTKIRKLVGLFTLKKSVEHEEEIDLLVKAKLKLLLH